MQCNPEKLHPTLMIKYLNHPNPPIRVHILLFFFPFVVRLEARKSEFLTGLEALQQGAFSQGAMNNSDIRV